MITAEEVGVWEEGSLLIVEYQLKAGEHVLGTSTLRLRPHQFKDDAEMGRFVEIFLAGRARKANKAAELYGWVDDDDVPEGRSFVKKADSGGNLSSMHEVTRGKTVAELAREGGNFKPSRRRW